MSAQQLITEHIDLWTSAIKARNTQGRGSSKKRELYGIKKLRELILELAVHGKLVQQDPNDEPASELLKHISTEKEQLVKDKKIKKQKPLLTVAEEEKSFELPNKWEWVRFGEIALHNAGKTLDKGRNSGELRDYITTSNLYWGTFKLGKLKQMPIKAEELEKCSARKNDLLICEGGEAGRAAVWPYEKEICFQNHVHRARFFGNICPYYMFRIFQWLDFTGLINNYRKGVAISNMSGKALASIPFGLPPIDEQSRIVAKVDELMALCDQLEQQAESSLEAHNLLVDTLLTTLTDARDANELSDNWTRLADHFDTLIITHYAVEQLKQTILQLAVQGKLVPQDPNDEPASELLKRIAAEKEQLIKDKKIKKQKPLPVISDEEKPFELPKGWEWSRIGDASVTTDYGLSDKSSIGEVGVPVLAMGHIQSGKVLLGGQKVVPESVDSLPDLYLENRDLLYNRTNSAELVGKTGLFDGSDNMYTFASYLIRIRTLKDTALPEFININMLTPTFRTTQIDPYLKQQCGQANVNGTIMKSMRVAIAPEKEQRRIVTQVDELMTLCDQLKAQLNDAQTTQLRLTDAIGKQAIG